ncbi:fungal-specific transcription factor domain-containing protein [Aspergillus crustosus]
MLLLLSQVQQIAHGKWRIHLQGFKQLIDFYGGCDALISRYLDAGFILSNVLIIDTMSTTTCPATRFGADIKRWLTTYLEVLPYLDHDLIPSPTPIPPRLLRVIIMINLLRATSNPLEVNPHLSSTFSQILSDLDITCVYELGACDEKRPRKSLEIGSTCKPPGAQAQQVQTPSQTFFHECYRSAVVLYAMATFPNLDPTHESVDIILTPEAVNAIQISAYSSLLQSLWALFKLKDNSLGKEAHWKFIFWPLAMAGVHSVVLKHDRDDFDYICAQLYEMTAKLGTLCMRDAAVFLQRLWEVTSDTGVGGLGQNWRVLTWDEIFKDAPLFLL